MPMRFQNKITESRLIHGNNDDVLCNLPAHSIKVMITDPPYNFTKSGTRKTYKEGSKKLIAKSGLYDYDSDLCRIKIQFGENEINAFLNQIPRVMIKMNAFIFCAEAQLSAYISWAERHGYKYAILVWEKPVNIISKKRFAQNVEFIIRIYEQGTALNSVDDLDLYNRVFHSHVVTRKQHPTQKPIEIFERIIQLTTDEGDAVLDPYLGSGTTAVAAKRLERLYVGIEKDDAYFAIAESRLNEVAVQGDLFNQLP